MIATIRRWLAPISSLRGRFSNMGGLWLTRNGCGIMPPTRGVDVCVEEFEHVCVVD